MYLPRFKLTRVGLAMHNSLYMIAFGPLWFLWSFNPVFLFFVFMLLTLKSFETFLKHYIYMLFTYFAIYGSFALNWYISAALSFSDLEKLTEYSASAVNVVVSSDPYVGPFQRAKISFYLSPICTDGLLLTSKVITFLRQSKFGNE